ncbi:MAG: hypothetical protein OSB82_10515, partial [Alphaproteobacteria bacterium]|nr:hypothetical protein [Alphaproteobacteria bacterium]
IEDWARKVVRGYLPEEHRDFHCALPYLIVTARDGAGWLWATLLTGEAGFVTSPDPQTLVIAARPAAGDTLGAAFVQRADLGVLGIELSSRRRNRLNGRILDGRGGGAIICDVEQSFGNCPQYIRERAWRRVECAAAGRPKKKRTVDQSANRLDQHRRHLFYCQRLL